MDGAQVSRRSCPNCSWCPRQLRSAAALKICQTVPPFHIVHAQVAAIPVLLQGAATEVCTCFCRNSRLPSCLTSDITAEVKISEGPDGGLVGDAGSVSAALRVLVCPPTTETSRVLMQMVTNLHYPTALPAFPGFKSYQATPEFIQATSYVPQKAWKAIYLSTACCGNQHNKFQVNVRACVENLAFRP